MRLSLRLLSRVTPALQDRSTRAVGQEFEFHRSPVSFGFATQSRAPSLRAIFIGESHPFPLSFKSVGSRLLRLCIPVPAAINGASQRSRPSCISSDVHDYVFPTFLKQAERSTRQNSVGTPVHAACDRGSARLANSAGQPATGGDAIGFLNRASGALRSYSTCIWFQQRLARLSVLGISYSYCSRYLRTIKSARNVPAQG